MSSRIVALVLWVALCSGVTLAAKTHVDHDGSYDFSVPKTIAWGSEGTPAPSELTQRRIERAIVEALGAVGLEQVEDAADLKVLTHAVVDTETRNSSVSVGVGLGRSTSWGGIGIGGSREVARRELRIGTLVVQLIDTATGHLVWEGQARETFDTREDGERVAAKVEAAVERLFRKYPPKPKKSKKKKR